MESTQIFVLGGVLLYMIAMLAIGFWASRKVHSISDFLVAGRNLPFHLALATLFATWFGGGTVMGASGAAYGEGLFGVVADPIAAGVALIIAGFFYVGLLRRMELLTVTDIFGKYYSKGTEIFASILMIPVYIGWLGSQMVALGYLLNVLTGMNSTMGILLGAVIVVIYTCSGGMWAVTITDFFQVIILVAGLFILFPAVLGDVGGMNNLLESTPNEFWRFTPQGGNFNEWTAFLGQWALMGLGVVVGQDLIQRSLASKTEKIAKTSAIGAGLLYLTIGMIPVLLGVAGSLLLPGLDDAELVIPKLAMQYLPPMLLVLFVGALISAIMSSADSSLLAASSLLTQNVIRKIFPEITEQKILRLTRISTIILAILSMAVALYVKQIYDLMVNTWATLFVAILVPVTAALYWKKANTLSTWISMIAGTTVWVGFILFESGNFLNATDELFNRAALYGGIVSGISYVLSALLIHTAEQ